MDDTLGEERRRSRSSSCGGGSYIKAHPRESYREVGRTVRIQVWKAVVIA
ncbi:MAG: hypothetical protein P4N24_15715 [Acidobacteriota bacterium]|nr:hypothetical protein [Acidobacteriota bacterium]